MKKIYLCAAQEPDAAAALCSLAALLYLERELAARGFAVTVGGSAADACNSCQPHGALMLATSMEGSGTAVYHPVTADWQRYGASCRLALLVEEQARRYRLLRRRDIMSGPQIRWLQQVEAPAVLCVCSLPHGSVYDHLPQIAAQARGYAQAVTLWSAPHTDISNTDKQNTDRVNQWRGVQDHETMF